MHITGGGFHENIPRILPDGTSVVIDRSTFPSPEIFSVMQREGDISNREMFTTFNMGIGLMIFVDPAEGDRLMASLRKSGEKSFLIGEVTANRGDRVTIK